MEPHLTLGCNIRGTAVKEWEILNFHATGKAVEFLEESICFDEASTSESEVEHPEDHTLIETGSPRREIVQSPCGFQASTSDRGTEIATIS